MCAQHAYKLLYNLQKQVATDDSCIAIGRDFTSEQMKYIHIHIHRNMYCTCTKVTLINMQCHCVCVCMLHLHMMSKQLNLISHLDDFTCLITYFQNSIISPRTSLQNR